MAKKEVEVKVKAELTGIAKLRSELKEVKGELADALSMDNVDPKKIEELTKRAGELKDQMTDINEQIDLFATGSKYEAVSNSFGAIGTQLRNLDFQGASERAQAFATAAKKITFKDAIGSVSDLGKTFFQVGRALLTNPLFLLGSIIALIVVKVYEFLDSIGFIQKALDVLMWPINKLIEGLKALTDYFGITDFEGQKAAENKAKAYEDAAKRQEAASNQIIQGLDNEIRMAQLLGKDTVALEREKLQEIRKTAKARYDADKAAYEAGLKNKELTREEIAALKEKAIASRIAANQSYEDIKFFDAKTKKDKDDAKKKDDEEDKKSADKARADRNKAYQDRLKQQQEEAAARLKATREIEDLTNALLKDGVDKEIVLNNEKYKRLIEDTKSNEKLKIEERDKIVALLEQQQKANEEKIREEDRKKRADEEKAAMDEYSALMMGLNENRFFVEKETINKETEDRLNLLREQQQKGLISKEQLDAAEIALEEEKQRKLSELAGSFDGGLSPIEKAKVEAEELRLIEKQRLDAGIIDEQEYAARIEQINKDLNAKIAEDDKATRDKKIEYMNAGLDAASGAFSAIASLSQAVNEVQIANAEGNEEKQEQLRKKGFEQNKKMQIAQATMSGIQGVINALTAQSTIPEPFGSILKGVNAAIVATTTVANIAKIKATKYTGGGSVPDTGGGGSGAAERSMPNVSFTGGGNNDMNTVGAGGGQAPMTITAVVSETEITSVQDKNASRVKNAEL